MFSNISWGQYFIGVIIVVTVYYATAFFLYRKSWGNTLSRLRRKLTSQPDGTGEEEAFDSLETIVEELKTEIMEPMGNNAGKQELLAALSERLQYYSGMQRPAYRRAITNYILKNAKQVCGVVYNEEELNEAWDKLRW